MTMVHLLAQLPLVALDLRAPLRPATETTSDAAAASFDTRMLQAISGQSEIVQPPAPQADNVPPELPENATPEAIASILAKSVANVSKAVVASGDGAAEHPFETDVAGQPDVGSGTDGAATDPPPATLPSLPPPPPIIAPSPVTAPTPTIVATAVTASPKTPGTAPAAVDAQQTALAVPTAEQRNIAVQSAAILPPMPPETGTKATTSVKAATPEASALLAEAPFSSVAANISTLDVSTSPSLEASVPPRALDLSGRDWAARLSNEMLTAQRGDGELAFRLNPQHLGTLEVGLTETAQGLIVELQASKEEAARIIARDEPRLVEELRQRGVPVVEVSLRNGAGDDGRNPRNGSNPAPQPPLTMNDPHGHEDQDQQQARESGRLA
jgi:flagellar hook-length control protein FliK